MRALPLVGCIALAAAPKRRIVLDLAQAKATLDRARAGFGAARFRHQYGLAIRACAIDSREEARRRQQPLDVQADHLRPLVIGEVHSVLQQVPGVAYVDLVRLIPADVVNLQYAPDLWRDRARALRVGLEAPMLLTGAFLRATEGWRGPRKVLNISSGLGRRARARRRARAAARTHDDFAHPPRLGSAHTRGRLLRSRSPGRDDRDGADASRGERENAPGVSWIDAVHALRDLRPAGSSMETGINPMF